MWAAATNPVRSWGAERHRAADVLDAIAVVAWALGAYDRDKCPEPPRVVRPRDVEARRAARAKSKAARARLESGGWEEI